MAEFDVKQTDLAVLLGVGVSTIRRWQKNVGSPTADKLALISDRHGVDLNWLVTGKGKMREASPQWSQALEAAEAGRIAEEQPPYKPLAPKEELDKLVAKSENPLLVGLLSIAKTLTVENQAALLRYAVDISEKDMKDRDEGGR